MLSLVAFVTVCIYFSIVWQCLSWFGFISPVAGPSCSEWGQMERSKLGLYICDVVLISLLKNNSLVL